MSGKTEEFLFSPNESASDIAQHVYDNWPEGNFVVHYSLYFNNLDQLITMKCEVLNAILYLFSYIICSDRAEHSWCEHKLLENGQQ